VFFFFFCNSRECACVCACGAEGGEEDFLFSRRDQRDEQVARPKGGAGRAELGGVLGADGHAVRAAARVETLKDALGKKSGRGRIGVRAAVDDGKAGEGGVEEVGRETDEVLGDGGEAAERGGGGVEQGGGLPLGGHGNPAEVGDEGLRASVALQGSDRKTGAGGDAKEEVAARETNRKSGGAPLVGLSNKSVDLRREHDLEEDDKGKTDGKHDSSLKTIPTIKNNNNNNKETSTFAFLLRWASKFLRATLRTAGLSQKKSSHMKRCSRRGWRLEARTTRPISMRMRRRKKMLSSR
jgi:hypothetical protein